MSAADPIRHEVRQARKELGVTQSQMARDLGISVSSINRMERGIGTVIPTTRILMLEYLGVEDEPKPKGIMEYVEG